MIKKLLIFIILIILFIFYIIMKYRGIDVIKFSYEKMAVLSNQFGMSDPLVLISLVSFTAIFLFAILFLWLTKSSKY